MPSRRAAQRPLKATGHDESVEPDADGIGWLAESLHGGFSSDASSCLDHETSDTSEYNGKRRKAFSRSNKRRRTKQSAFKLTLQKDASEEPSCLPPLSDVEYDSSAEVDAPFAWLKYDNLSKPQSEGAAVVQSTTMSTTVSKESGSPKVVQINFNPRSENDGTTINLDLSALIHDWSNKRASVHNGGGDGDNGGNIVTNRKLDDDDDDDEPNEGDVISSSSIRQRLQKARLRQVSYAKPKIGFLDLPYEIRLRIYRALFVRRQPINFFSRQDFSRSASFLRTCKTIHQEGTEVLYSQNAFHFLRTRECRGRYFEEKWYEIGFKDVHRFLRTIGDRNLSMIRYATFTFEDAGKAFGGIDDSDRRFVNDPVVWHCLEVLGNGSHLFRFSFKLCPRRAVTRHDISFLRALASVKAEQVEAIHSSCYPLVTQKVLDDLLSVMRTPGRCPEGTDSGRKTSFKVLMPYDAGLWGKGRWR